MLSSWTVPQKIMLSVSGVLLLSGGAFWYISQKQEKMAVEVRTQADAAIQRVNSLQQKAAQQVHPADLAKMGRAIPNDWEMGLFLADLVTAAKEKNVTLVNVSPQAKTNQAPSNSSAGQPNHNQPSKQGEKTEADFSSPPPELPGVTSLEVALSAKGGAVNLLSFVDRLQQMPRLVWINEYKLNFNAKGAARQTGARFPASQLDLKLTIYSHAPWDARAAAAVEWPFPIRPAGKEDAFGSAR